MRRFQTGLVVGKFCPLHHGHQVMLDQARAQCEQLVIISYTKPGFAGLGAERRERWLAALYPDAIRLVLDDARLAELCAARGLPPMALPYDDESDDTHRGFVARLLQDVLEVDVDAVFTSEAYGDGFAAFLTDAQHGRGGLPVVHVPVDPDRGAVPVSGTQVRADVHGMRHRLDPIVYRDFVQRVAILGGESTGKSTLARKLAEHLKTVHAAEYGRELWEQRAGALIEEDMLHIAHAQVAREDALSLEANGWLICDTTPLTTLLYSQAMFGSVVDELESMARRPYDVVLLCSPDVPFVQDGTRQEEAFRQWQQRWYLGELHAREIRYQLLEGKWEERLVSALRYIRASGNGGAAP